MSTCRHHNIARSQRLPDHCQQHSADHIGRHSPAWSVSGRFADYTINNAVVHNTDDDDDDDDDMMMIAK